MLDDQQTNVGLCQSSSGPVCTLSTVCLLGKCTLKFYFLYKGQLASRIKTEIHPLIIFFLSPATAQTQLGSPGDLLPKTMHVSHFPCSVSCVLNLKSFGYVIMSSSSSTQSTPLPARLMDHKASLSNGDQCMQTCDLELSSKSLPHVRSGTIPPRSNVANHITSACW